MISVVLADRDRLVRNLLELVCSNHDLRVVGDTSSAKELIGLCRTERPDVAVSDLELDDALLLDRLDELLATGVRVIVLCDDATPECLTAVLVRGASGYLLHDTAPEQVVEAILAVAAGDAALHPAVARTILYQWRRLRGGATNGEHPRTALTPRESDVLAAMADGLSTKAIARRLGVALKTVENHKIRVFDKLGVSTHAQAVALAIGHGLLAPPSNVDAVEGARLS